MSAVFRGGKMVQLDRRASQDQVVTSEQAADPEQLARVLNQLLKDNAELLKRFYPRRIDFEGVVLTATAFAPPGIRLHHGFGGQIRWWVADTNSASSNLVIRSDDSDENTLVLLTNIATTVVIRIEDAG